VSWSEVMLALLVSHVVGDVLLQTDEQAREKVLGFSDTTGRRALVGHVATYLAAFIPALVWIALETSALRALAVAALVAITHLVIDDGRLVRLWLRNVKRAANPARALSIAVDQSFHVLCLLGAALVAAS
jgi:type IV secretory pathway VirB3-like protein